MHLERLVITHGDAMLTVAFDRDEPAQDQPVEALRQAYALGLAWLQAAMDGEPAAQPQPAAPAPAAQPAPAYEPPKDAAEAERRFFQRYGETTNAQTWNGVLRWLGSRMPKPRTVEEWMHAARLIRAEANRRAAQQEAA